MQMNNNKKTTNNKDLSLNQSEIHEAQIKKLIHQLAAQCWQSFGIEFTCNDVQAHKKYNVYYFVISDPKKTRKWEFLFYKFIENNIYQLQQIFKTILIMSDHTVSSTKNIDSGKYSALFGLNISLETAKGGVCVKIDRQLIDQLVNFLKGDIIGKIQALIEGSLKEAMKTFFETVTNDAGGTKPSAASYSVINNQNGHQIKKSKNGSE